MRSLAPRGGVWNLPAWCCSLASRPLQPGAPSLLIRLFLPPLISKLYESVKSWTMGLNGLHNHLMSTHGVPICWSLAMATIILNLNSLSILSLQNFLTFFLMAISLFCLQTEYFYLGDLVYWGWPKLETRELVMLILCV